MRNSKLLLLSLLGCHGWLPILRAQLLPLDLCGLGTGDGSIYGHALHLGSLLLCLLLVAREGLLGHLGRSQARATAIDLLLLGTVG